MILYILLALSVAINIFFIYCAVNVIKKMEQYEDWISYFRSEIEKVLARLKLVDDRQMFEKDDDVGFIFAEILRIIKEFNERIK